MRSRVQKLKPIGFTEFQFPTLVDDPPEGGGWIHEIKYDGYRTQIVIQNGQALIYTRTGIDWSTTYPHIAAAAGWLKCRTRSATRGDLAARTAGVTVFQPWKAVGVQRGSNGSRVTVQTRERSEDLIAPVVIAAHGSWEQGKLQTNLEKQHGPRDFLGFKAHFKSASLGPGVMPLLVFPGGYGGMVWADGGRLSLSCCIRRDRLEAVRHDHPGLSAAEAVHRHILSSCPAAFDVLGKATLEGQWLAAGPIRPGIRQQYHDDVFRVGNLAGESHPIIAEGISMALQSGWMLAQELSGSGNWDEADRNAAGKRYSDTWRRQFSTRIRLASLLAGMAISPRTASVMRAVVGAFPPAL